jgi:hypothetical protein
MPTEVPEEIVKKERQRSPNYPAVGLREAVERVRKLYETDGKAGALPEIAAKHIGYSSAHGQAMSVLAALKKFGLVSEVGGRLAPTQAALEIINLPDTDVRRKKALRESALSPALYKELAEKHQETGLPAPDSLEAELVTYKGFNPKAVGGLVRDFVDTLDFAGIIVGGTVESEKKADEGGTKPKMGDYVQWVSQGVEQFHLLKKVVGFSEDGKYAFFEGEKTGAPVNELEIGEAPATPPPPPTSLRWTRAQLQPPAGGSVMRDDVYSLDDGRQVVISWPSSLPEDEVANIKDWLKIVEKKIAKSGVVKESTSDKPED